MRSKYLGAKDAATKLRMRGASIRDVETRLGIPRSTLSGWFRNIRLGKRESTLLELRKKRSLRRARSEAVKWHNAGKQKRILEAKRLAAELLSKIELDSTLVELALALLYLGEGNKISQTSMGNSDPVILRFFVQCLRRIYRIPMYDIKCELHLRADQNATKMKRYWSRALRLPSRNFMSVSVDRRTRGTPTYKHYKGVCLVRCGRVAIQRKLVYIAEEFCTRVATDFRQ